MILIFISTSSLVALSLSLIVGALSPVLSGVALIAGVALAAVLRPPKGDGLRLSWDMDGLLIGLLLIVGFYQFLYLVFESQGYWHVGNPNNLGDLPLHINYIRGFAKGVHFWPMNPEYSLEPLKYPFGMDLFNALFESIGVPVRAHLFLVGFICFVLSMHELRARAGAWALAGFFLSGGYSSAQDLLQGTSWLPAANVDWKNLFLAVFVTQRGFLFALPAGLWLASQMTKPRWNQKEKIATSLVWGALAFFHLHSFFIVSLILGLRSILRGQWRQQMGVMAGALTLALPFILITVSGGTNLGHSLGLMSFWKFTGDSAVNLLLYVVKNFGPWIAIAGIVGGLAWRRSTWRQRLDSMLPLLLFFCFLFVKMAPWAWDNIKILLWCYLFLLFEYYDLYVQKTRMWWQWGMIVIFFYPGIFQLAASLPSRVKMARLRPSLQQLECQVSLFGPDDVIATAPDFDHVLMLQGHRLALGYEGHVWSHGYPLADRQKRLKILMTKAAGWPQAAKEMGAKWVFWGQNERARYGEFWGTEADSPNAINEFCGAKVYDLSTDNSLQSLERSHLGEPKRQDTDH